MEELNGDRNDGTDDSLGARLRKAREYKGLDLDSVAHQLNLSQQRINDMENDDYRFAVAESYAKGYLRMYAKLLGLDPDLIVLEFERMRFGDNIQHHRTKLIMKRQITSGDGWMRWSTYSIGIVLVFLVAIWWRSQPSHSDNLVVSTESSDQTTTDISAQATRKTENSDRSSTQNLSDDASLLQKPDLSSTQTQDSLQDLSKTESQKATDETSAAQASKDQKDKTVFPSAQTNANQKSTSASVTSSTATTKNSSTTTETSTNKMGNSTSTQTSTAVSKPKAQSSDEEDSEDEEEDSSEDSSDNVQGLLFKKSLKPKVFLGQREQDEQALLRELEKVFNRG